jgi:deoxyribose-phosphate aldolase
MTNLTKKQLAGMIDHTLLKPEATVEQIEKICEEAEQYHFASVCVNPCYTKLAYRLLQGSGVKVCTVIGFPLGANMTEIKALEAKAAVRGGAEEIDMVINVGMLKSGNLEYVLEDIKAVVQAVEGSAIVKVILETCLLTDSEKATVCELSKEAGAHYVKTSTGFSKGGATDADIKLMYDAVPPELKVKASGGVRTLDDALKMIDAGASRIGASASIEIINEL